MYAIFRAVLYWKTKIGGSKMLVFTDSNNLLGYKTNYDKKVERWNAELLEFNIDNRIIEGRKNIMANELSRRHNKLNMIKPLDDAVYGPQTFDCFIENFHILHGHPGFKKTIYTLGKLTKENRKKIYDAIKTTDYCQKTIQTSGSMEL